MSKKVSKKAKQVKDSGMRLAIMAPGLKPKELDALRTQIEMAMVDPGYVIITNYHFDTALVPVIGL